MLPCTDNATPATLLQQDDIEHIDTLDTHENNDDDNTNVDFYKKAKDYWAHLPPTENAVLGGYGHISQIDLQGSRHFLQQIFKSDRLAAHARALDCGAGIGRISRCLLTTIYNKVDLVEQNPEFLKEARNELSHRGDRVGEFYAVGLQDFQPSEKYDLIWCQWVLGHLTDEDLIKFFERCKSSLAEGGMIVVKENLSSTGQIEMDVTDSSITRSYQCYLKLFEHSGLKCIKKQKQMHFPKELYPVFMFALRPQG